MLVANIENKLKPFILKDKDYKETDFRSEDKPMLEAFKSIYYTDNFAIATNSFMVGVCFLSDNHSLNMNGDLFDNVLKIVKKEQEADEPYKITIDREEVINALVNQKKQLKSQIKTLTTDEQNKFKRSKRRLLTRFNVYYEKPNVFLNIKTQFECMEEYTNRASTIELSREKQARLTADIQKGNGQKVVDSWECYFQTDFISKCLKFVAGKQITLFSKANGTVSPVWCESKDRMFMLWPVRVY